MIYVNKSDKEINYPVDTPYNPHINYPEYPFGDNISIQKNYVYDLVRDTIRKIGLDEENYGTDSWNPFKGYLVPGQTVVIKPNFVQDYHPSKMDIFSIITHPSVIRTIMDYCYIALKGRGKIIIADAPQYNCNFENLCNISKLSGIRDLFGDIVEVRDLRKYWSDKMHFESMKIKLDGDPLGSSIFDLKEESLFYGKNNMPKIYGASFYRDEILKHHSQYGHTYEIANTLLKADMVIFIPKLKTHKKVGTTLVSKGLVGMSTDKNCLVHYTLGSVDKNGDQYPPKTFNLMERVLIGTERLMYELLLRPKVAILEKLHRFIYYIHNHTTKNLGIKVNPKNRKVDCGNWYGNDSAWRMTADLVNISNKHIKNKLCIVDGIIGGSEDGPLNPTPKNSSLIVIGDDIVFTDLVATHIMGFDCKKIKLYKYFLDTGKYNGYADVSSLNEKYIPHVGWKNKIER